MRRSHRIVGLIISLALFVPGPASAAGGRRPLTATLDGRAISLASVGSLHCHDLDHPIIRCFRSQARLDRAIRRSVGSRLRRPGAAGITAVAYVRVYEHSHYEGASIHLSISYANLATIGWNDRISSYKSVNGGAGTFWHDAYQDGTDDDFCCNTNVANVGSTHNDRFSSVSGSA
jgi:hypothetical protein